MNLLQKNLSTSIILTLLMSLFIVPNMAFAKGGRGLFKQLDLTQEQKAQLKEMRKQRGSKEDRQANKGKMKELKEKIRNGFINGDSASTLQGYHNELKNFKMERMDRRFNKLLKLQSILTKEQMKKYMELRKQRKGSRRK